MVTDPEPRCGEPQDERREERGRRRHRLGRRQRRRQHADAAQRDDEQHEPDEAGDGGTAVGCPDSSSSTTMQQRRRQHDERRETTPRRHLPDDERPGRHRHGEQQVERAGARLLGERPHRQQRHERDSSRKPASGKSGWITACSRARSWSTNEHAEHDVEHDAGDVRASASAHSDGEVPCGSRPTSVASLSVSSARLRRRRAGTGPRGRRPRRAARRRRPAAGR